MNFEQILKQKMQERPTTSSSTAATENVGIDPAHLAFLMGHVTRKNATRPLASAYKPTIFPRTPHILSAPQQEAFAFFQSHLPELSDCFTRAEIKSSFRKIALLLHPDQGGSAQAFMQLREHYKTLFSIPKK